MIPFNKPALLGSEKEYIQRALRSGVLSANGAFTQKVHEFFRKEGYASPYLTGSCTAALEMAALVAGIGQGDEVIMPSFTYVSTANAFALRGASLVFADSEKHSPNIDVQHVESLITPKTKALVCVHYGGVACDLDALTTLSKKHNLVLIEDAAHALGSRYKNKPLGTFGTLGVFSFHETKNITAGEAGLLCVNDPSLTEKADIAWEKGTNRKEFQRGNVEKYEWVGLGSSFAPSELTAAFLLAQLESAERINAKRRRLWKEYRDRLEILETHGKAGLPAVPDFASANGHLFFLLCQSAGERKKLIAYLYENGIQAVFHYQALHNSRFFSPQYKGDKLAHAERYSDCLVRLPLFYAMKMAELEKVTEAVLSFYKI